MVPFLNSTAKESRSELPVFVVFQSHSVLITRVSELYSWPISFAGKILTVATENTQAGEIIGNYILPNQLKHLLSNYDSNMLTIQ